MSVRRSPSSPDLPLSPSEVEASELNQRSPRRSKKFRSPSEYEDLRRSEMEDSESDLGLAPNLYIRREDEIEWNSLFEEKVEYTPREIQDEINKYSQDTLGAENSNVNQGVNKYRGISIKEAYAIVESHEDGVREDPKKLVCEYSEAQLTRIRSDMTKMLEQGYVGGTYSAFKELNPPQANLLHHLDKLLYDYECPYAINNSATGTGKSLMGLAQALMSECPYIVIVGPPTSKSAWMDAVKMLPQIKASLERWFRKTYLWPKGIWFASSSQLIGPKGTAGRFQPMFVGQPSIDAIEPHKIKSTRFKTKDGKPQELDIYTLTGSAYAFGPDDEISSKAAKYVKKYNLQAPKDEVLIFTDPDEAQRRRAHQGDRDGLPLTTRRMIEDGMFYIYDEFHGSKNDTKTSRATGIIPAEIVRSHGGISDFRVISDHTYKKRGYHLRYIPYRGEPFRQGAHTGKSRILLMSATATDRDETFSIGRTLGLYAGEGKAKSFFKRGGTNDRVTDEQARNDTAYNLGFYLTIIEDNLQKEEKRLRRETGDRDYTLPRPRLMEYLDGFRDYYLKEKKRDRYAIVPDVDSIVRSILGDPFFIRAIAYDGKYKQEMNDLIVSMDGKRSEDIMVDLVRSASRFFVGKSEDEDPDAPEQMNPMTALVRIEERLVPHAVRKVIQLLKADPRHRVVIGLSYNSGIARVFNKINKYYLQDLGIVAPLLLTGRTENNARIFVNALFQHNLKYRLLIANVQVIKQSISLHPLYKYWYTTVIVPIPRNAVDYYQISGRVLRHGSKADSQFLVISPGMRHNYRFYLIKGVGDIIDLLRSPEERKNKLTWRMINDAIVQLIIDDHTYLKSTHPKWDNDMIHQLHLFKNNTEVEAPFRDYLRKYFTEELTKARLPRRKGKDRDEMILKRDNLISQVPIIVDKIIARYKRVSVDYPISLVNLIRRRNEKTENLQSVTSEERQLPKSAGYIESGALLSPYMTDSDMTTLTKDEIDQEAEASGRRFDQPDEEADTTYNDREVSTD